jgi:hypothetical protein
MTTTFAGSGTGVRSADAKGVCASGDSLGCGAAGGGGGAHPESKSHENKSGTTRREGGAVRAFGARAHEVEQGIVDVIRRPRRSVTARFPLAFCLRSRATRGEAPGAEGGAP